MASSCYIGDPEDVGSALPLRLNFAGAVTSPDAVVGDWQLAVPDIHARIVSARLIDESGERGRQRRAG